MNIRFFSRIMLCGTLASGIPVMNQALAVTDSAPIQVDSKTIKVTGIVKDIMSDPSSEPPSLKKAQPTVL